MNQSTSCFQKRMKGIVFSWMIIIAGIQTVSNQINAQAAYEQYRPLIHFSPAKNWMNDPNGMVYYKGVYHLFFQYYPDATVWGPMHWGHAVSKDLVDWKEQPIALFPDSLGYIFSGSIVADLKNSSGFGQNGVPPLVAIFTQHNDRERKTGSIVYQNQSLAFSLDDGKSWVKYAGNPVLKNPGITDFRDPKVMWHEESKKWIMTLATKDHITFYSSADLKNWEKQTEFGSSIGAHGGVWECPDLFSLDYEGKKIWVLLISINPGAPNGGSGTQYFTGTFDGKTFTPFQTDTRWLDYGRDNYAGITWSNTGSRKIFIGWMSNWQYANQVPTDKWRGANTIPRDLAIQKVNDKYYVTSQPVKELSLKKDHAKVFENIKASGFDIDKNSGAEQVCGIITIDADKADNFSLVLSNDAGEQLIAGYDKSNDSYFIDRTRAGKSGFQKSFSGRHLAPRLSKKAGLNITLIVDRTSIEMFADDGLSVMTDIFFPANPLNKIRIQGPDNFLFRKISYAAIDPANKNHTNPELTKKKD